MLTPQWRKLALTAHVTASVGWLGAVVVFVALALIGLTSGDGQTLRGAYRVMEPVAWYVIVPLALASLLTGVVESLGTTWGLFRHYWVLFKLVITTVASIVVLMYLPTLRDVAEVASDRSAKLDVVRDASPLVHSAVGLVLLLVATALSVYKPRGMTSYGYRAQHEQRSSP